MTEFERFTNPRAYIADWCSRKTWEELNHKNAEINMQLDYYNEFQVWRAQNNSRTGALDKKLLAFAFQAYMDGKAEEKLKQEMQLFMCTGENLAPLKQWLAYVVGEPTELDVLVLAHWIWAVKRKAMDLKVIHHIMPIFFGRQGAGKSEAIKYLISPLRDFWGSFGMDQLGDPRNYDAFSHTLIAFFDELQRIQKTDLNVLKNQITTEKNTYRVLGTHRQNTVPMKCSFIGATNKPLDENFSDETGMRRFYEFRTNIDPANWKPISRINYMELWNGVDERLPEGYLTETVRVQLEKHQEQYRDADTLDEFISELQIKIPPGGHTKIVTKVEIFTAYSMWCNTNNIKPTTSQWLTKRLKNKGYETYIEGVTRYFVINSASPIGLKHGIGVVK